MSYGMHTRLDFENGDHQAMNGKRDEYWGRGGWLVEKGDRRLETAAVTQNERAKGENVKQKEIEGKNIYTTALWYNNFFFFRFHGFNL